MAEEISKANPFSKNRTKVKFNDKSQGTPFAGMTTEKIDRFMTRNVGNFKRRFKKIYKLW